MDAPSGLRRLADCLHAHAGRSDSQSEPAFGLNAENVQRRCWFGPKPNLITVFAITRYPRPNFVRQAGAPSREILALRHQLNVLRRTSPRRPVFSNFDRMIFVCLYRIAPRILDALTISLSGRGWPRARLEYRFGCITAG
jgi:hypothetical protein